MLTLYNAVMKRSGPVLRRLLAARLRAGREDAARLPERIGEPSRSRPAGRMVWVHAASVGEAQSALKLLGLMLTRDPALHILITSGTVTSARLLSERLPARAIHQFYPLDHPGWTGRFLDHWRPDLALWLESEIWPGMLAAMKARSVPAILLNARLSPRSARRWSLARRSARQLLDTFALILAQTDGDAARFHTLGAMRVETMVNLKYAALLLPCDDDELAAYRSILENRPCWVFASTHDGEEALACRIHARLKSRLPGLLTMIVPRHPERGPAIAVACAASGLGIQARSTRPVPDQASDIYLADTLGELGLFYRLCPVACIGRSFSDDGGGGHNPVEAALLGCAVLHGPNVQNLRDIYDEMDGAGAARPLAGEDALAETLAALLGYPALLAEAQRAALSFTEGRSHAAEAVLARIAPWLDGVAA